MRHPFLVIMLFCVLCGTASSCDKQDDGIRQESNQENNDNESNMTGSKILIKVGSGTFTATLLDNNTAIAFQKLLPLTVNMTDLNRNEKYYDLPNGLPVNSSNPGMIRNGDLMLYGSKTLVLFYKTFSTSYSYTRLGKVDDPQGLEAALGPGNAPVTFELKGI